MQQVSTLPEWHAVYNIETMCQSIFSVVLQADLINNSMHIKTMSQHSPHPPIHPTPPIKRNKKYRLYKSNNGALSVCATWYCGWDNKGERVSRGCRCAAPHTCASVTVETEKWNSQWILRAARPGSPGPLKATRGSDASVTGWTWEGVRNEPAVQLWV